MSMDGTAVDSIADLAERAAAKVVKVGEESFSTRPLYRTPLPEWKKENDIAVLKISSLQGVVDYLKGQKDGLSPEGCVVHIAGPTTVRVLGAIIGRGTTNQRHTYLSADVDLASHRWGHYSPVEDVIVALNSRFAQTNDRDLIVQVLGTMEEEKGIKTIDDGFSQQVVAKTGVARMGDVVVKNPIVLAPFRSFPEIAPVESAFLVRFQGTGRGASVALFETDGGWWEVETVRRIREFLAAAETGYNIIS